MQDSIHAYMKVGLIHFMAYPQTMRGTGPIEQSIQSIAQDDFFDAIEITWIHDSFVRKRVRQMLETARMTVAYGSQPRMLTTNMNINSLDEAQRQQALYSLLDGIDEAYEMGACSFAFLSGKYDPQRQEQAYEALVRSTFALCGHAREKGDMRIALEVFDYDMDKKALIGPAPLALQFAREITDKYDNFGLLVDSSHIPMIHESLEQSILPVAKYIRHAHMGNTVIADPSMEAYGDTHPRFGFPGSENDVPQLTDYLRLLLKIGFLNRQNPPIVSFEVKPWGDELPELVIANAKRTLNQAWANV